MAEIEPSYIGRVVIISNPINATANKSLENLPSRPFPFSLVEHIGKNLQMEPILDCFVIEHLNLRNGKPDDL